MLVFETIFLLSALQVFGHPNRLRRTCIVRKSNISSLQQNLINCKFFNAYFVANKDRCVCYIHS